MARVFRSPVPALAANIKACAALLVREDAQDAGRCRAGVARQLPLALFLSHELQAWSQEEGRRGERRLLRQGRRRSPRQATESVDNGGGLFDEIAICRPSSRVQPVSRREPPDAERRRAKRLRRSKPAAADRANQESWSDAAIYQLHEAVLHNALRTLHGRGARANKREVLQWIFAPVSMAAVVKTDASEVEVALPPSLTPFSFALCCRICGYRPEALRDRLHPVLKTLGVTTLFQEIVNASNKHCHDAGGEAGPVQDPDRLQPARGAGSR